MSIRFILKKIAINVKRTTNIDNTVNVYFFNPVKAVVSLDSINMLLEVSSVQETFKNVIEFQTF
jgi:hypothetical protein